MKRILIRMSALATVVVLGMIAIAQAQRSVNPSTAVADDSSNKSPAASPTSREDPFASRSDFGAPRPLPTTTRANPLRPESSTVSNPARTSSLRSPRPYSQTADEAENNAQPLTLSDRDSTTVMTTSGTGEMLDAAPRTSGQPTAAPRSTPLFPVQTPSTPADAQPESVAADSGAPTAADTAAAADDPAANPYGTSPFDNRTPAAGEPSLLRADPFSHTAGSSQPALAPIDEASTAIPPSSSREPLSEPGMLSPMDSALLGTGTGTPGSKQLEGAQSPQITIEKIAPPEIQVGKPATFQIRVRNSGKVAAHSVELHDEIPKGTRLMNTTPPATQGVRGEMVWSLGTMQPGDEVTAEVQLMPVEEGEIGSVATARFNAEASAKTIATKPELVVETSAPAQVLVGEPLTLSITITNPGSGVATGVVLEERIPAGLQHPAGTELEYEVGDLKPKESRKLQLQLTAERPGQVTNVIVARGEANLKAEHRLDIQVQAPQLDLAVDGPKRRYLEREAAYTVAITNPGTAPAQRVELIAQLPVGLKFVSANNAGHYNEAEHTVHWQLDELPVQETGTVKLVTMPIQAGEHKLLVSANADKGVSAEREQPVVIEGIAAIMFEVVDVNDPVEKGGETTYEIRVVNQGSKAATNVQLALNLPQGMRPIAAEGPTHHSITAANQIVFEGLSRLAPKADTTYRVRVQCLQPGDLRIQAQLLTSEIREPVTKEESTRVYADE